MNRLIWFLFFSFAYFYSNAQEQLGLRTENYAGINSVLLNPANNLTSPFRWDINLIAVGQFVDNNFGGYRDASIGDLLQANERDIFLATDFSSDQQFPAGSLVFDFADPGQEKYASFVTNVMGPSLMLNFEKHSFGFFTNFRANLSAQQILAILGYYDYLAIDIDESYTVGPAQAAGMVWGEIGLNYLYKTNTSSGNIGIGVSLKYLRGYESFFIRNNNTIDATKRPLDAIDFNNGVDIEFGFTTSSVDEEAVNLQNSGSGFGIDLGITYASPNYINGEGLKLGLSVLDIGSIQFNNLTEQHTIDINNPFFFSPRNLEDVTDFRDGIAQLNEELFPDSDSLVTFTGDSYRLALPGAVSLQADIAIQENLFINATLINRLPIGENRVERGNLLAITPRYESRWVSAFLPISIFNYQRMKVGTAIRLAFLTFGTEDLMSFFRRNSLESGDFYLALKINPFNLGRKNKGGKEVECYSF